MATATMEFGNAEKPAERCRLRPDKGCVRICKPEGRPKEGRFLFGWWYQVRHRKCPSCDVAIIVVVAVAVALLRGRLDVRLRLLCACV